MSISRLSKQQLFAAVTAAAFVPVAASLALIYFLPVATQLRFLAWLAAGMVVYFGYAARRNRAVTETPG